MDKAKTQIENPSDAARVGGRAETERYFAARDARTTPARAKALLERLGCEANLREDDRLDAPE